MTTTETTASEVWTRHAEVRAGSRRIRPALVRLVVCRGREVRTWHSVCLVIGRREVLEWAARGVDVSEAEGVHVVLSHDDERVLTVYRDRSLGHAHRLRRHVGAPRRDQNRPWRRSAAQERARARAGRGAGGARLGD